MKKIIYYISILICSVTVSSCSLDETDYTEIEVDTYMNDASEAETVLLGVYRNMVSDGMYALNLSMYFTLPNDLAKIEGSTTDGVRAIASNAYTSSQTDIATTWLCLYNAIYDANSFIENLSQKIDSYSDSDYQQAAIFMAEARSLRALFYFELVRWYGNIALITTTAQSNQDPSTFTQADPADVYAFIEEDLLYAIDNLPYASDDDIRSDNSFRFSKGAALGLLAKVYATWAGYPVQDTSKWEKAAQTAKVLVESGKHSLLDSYETLWENTCNGVWDSSESLIEVSFYASTVTGSSSNDPCGRIGKWNGVRASNITGVRNAGNWYVIPTFLRDWKDRESDLRWSLSFADYRYNGTQVAISSNGTIEDALADDASDALKRSYINGINPRKWDTELYVEDANYLANANYSNINWYILRYADVLLLYAEALNESNQGPTDEAYEAVNMVRRRGFGLSVSTTSSTADLTEGMTYEEFQQAIRDERAYELAFEGQRRQDLVRWGIYYESIQQTAQDLVDWYTGGATYYICAEYTQKNKNELLPIPLHDLDLMSQFEQNPGW